jgi:hypothetical protein
MNQQHDHDSTQIEYSKETIISSAKERIAEIEAIIPELEKKYHAYRAYIEERTKANEDALNERERKFDEWEERNRHRWFPGENPYKSHWYGGTGLQSQEHIAAEYGYDNGVERLRKAKRVLDDLKGLMIFCDKADGVILLSAAQARIVFVPNFMATSIQTDPVPFQVFI